MTRTRAYALLILGWSLLVHGPGLTSPLLDYHAYRQCQTASTARDYVRHGMQFFKPETDINGPAAWTGTEFPLYSYLLAILYKAFGLREWLGRLLSVLLTAWSALFLFGLVRRRLGETVGLWSALVMCSLPVHIYFTRTVQPESMALWALIGFAYFLDRRLAGEKGLALTVATVALGALAPLLKLNFLYLVGGLWLVLGYDRRRWRRPAYWGLLLAVTALPFAWYQYARLAPVQVLPLGIPDQLENLRAIFQEKFWEAHFISRFPEICATYTGLLLGIVGARALWKKASGRFWFGWWLITALYTVLIGDYGWIHKYTDIPWAPINGVFIAVGLVEAWRWAGADRRRRAWVAVLVLGIPLHAALRIKHWYRLERLWLFRAHDMLARLSARRDLILTNTAEAPVLLYYLDRSGYVVDLDHATPAQFESSLARSRFFVTPVEGSWTRHPEWERFLDGRATLLYQDAGYWLYEVNLPVTKN